MGHNYKDDYPEWTVAHDLALIYLALTHGADEELDASEIDAMSQKLSEWNTHSSGEAVKKIMREVMLVYVGSSGDQMLEASIASVADEMSKPSRIAILNDLADIATADGTIVMGEIDFIQQLARDWGVDRDIR
jgi:uncharacterized tellurite resistance protein B-like protein